MGQADGRREQSYEALHEVEQGDPRAADRLLPPVYNELRSIARAFMQQERRNHTLDATALVHEAYLRLVDESRIRWNGRTHFKAVAARAMLQLLKEHARFHGRLKRGGGWRRVALHEGSLSSEPKLIDLESLTEALEGLSRFGDRKANVVEMRLAGMTHEEIAAALCVSTRTVEEEWRFARAWLISELEK